MGTYCVPIVCYACGAMGKGEEIEQRVMLMYMGPGLIHSVIQIANFTEARHSVPDIVFRARRQ